MAENQVLHIVLLLLSIATTILHSAQAKVPAVYIFGDSTADVGSNNHLSNPLVMANYPYYGIDFPGGNVTGRFSNGLNIADFLAKFMGFPMSPKAFVGLLNKKGKPAKQVMKGANFASAASGLLNYTGAWVGGIITLEKQIQQFGAVRRKIEKIIGPNATDALVSKSIFLITEGSCDIFENNLFRTIPDQQEFISALKAAYEFHIRTLYAFGARKFGILSVSNIGCVPSRRFHNDTGGCLDALNSDSLLLYPAIKDMLETVSSELNEMKYSLGNTYDLLNDVMTNPNAYGDFKELKTACCGNGTWNGGQQCLQIGNLCGNRKEYLFWDWNHPTEAACEVTAQTLYNGTTRYVTPINMKQLVDL